MIHTGYEGQIIYVEYDKDFVEKPRQLEIEVRIVERDLIRADNRGKNRWRRDRDLVESHDTVRKRKGRPRYIVEYQSALGAALSEIHT
jgi:hypothetical protein